jgi:hypothetical protein
MYFGAKVVNTFSIVNFSQNDSFYFLSLFCCEEKRERKQKPKEREKHAIVFYALTGIF